MSDARNAQQSQDKPREFWIDTDERDLQGPRVFSSMPMPIREEDKESVVHVIEYSAFEVMHERAERTEAELWVAKDSQLRTYDGMAQKADRADDLEKENAELRTRIEKLREALSECEGHFLSIELDYAAEVGNTPKMIANSALESLREALTADDALAKENK